MVRFARDLITAPDAKGQKGEKGPKRTEKGLKGNLNTNIPFGPLYSPLGPYL